MNYLVVTFKDKKQYSIPVQTLAALIAKYFARPNHRGDATYVEAYDAEFSYYRRNPEYLIPWVSDLPWTKIRRLLGFHGLSRPVISGYKKEWGNAYKEIIDL